MNATTFSEVTLRAENAELRTRLEEAEEMLRAIRSGEVDALVVKTAAGPKLFTLQGVDAEQNRMRGEMLAQVSDAVIATDIEDRITYLNAAAEQQYRVRIADVLGQKISEIYTRQWPSPEAETAAWAALEEHSHCCSEMLHRTRDGRELPVESSLAILHDSKTGERCGLIVAIRDITERKQAEAALRRNTELFSKIIKQAPGGVYVVDAHFRVAQMNAESLPFFGSVQPVIGRDFDEVLKIVWGPNIGLQIASIFRHTLATGERYVSPDFSERRHDIGTEQTFEWELQRVTLPDGLHGVVCYFQDVTSRERTAAALRDSEERLRLAIAGSDLGTWHWDIRTDVLDWSERCLEIFGIPPGTTMSYEKFLGALHPEDRACAEDAERRALQDGSEYRIEFRSVWPDGSVHWAVSIGRAYHDNTGEPIRMEGISLDITEHKRKETALKLSESRYRRLFESAKDGILILDAHAGTITDANPFMAEILGSSKDDFIGKELWQIGLFKDMEASQAAMRELKEKGYIHDEDLPLETKAGRRIHVEFISNLYGEDGQEVIQCNIRDISDRKRLEEILRQRAADLSESDRRKDEFLATLAHELRNPLAPIRNAIEVLRMKGPAIPELQWARDVIDRQTQAMARMIDDLMDLSRINQGKIELRREQVELKKIVKGAVETSRPLIEKMNHKLAVTLPPGPVIVDVDLTRMAQVFMNLLNNAAKYTEQGGRIDLRAELQGSDVVVSVIDTGIGIAAEKLPTVFEMFSQVEGALSRSQGGLGIGLCLVKRLVEMHGGSVEAKSGGLGKGSEFVVRLPIVVVQTYPRQLSYNGGKAKPIYDLRVLVVDDNRDAAETLAMLLKMMGNNVRLAHDGQEAVAAAGEFRPHVVLCDIGLPKLNGYEACRQIKEQAWDENMSLIAVTGWGQDDDRRKSEEAGFDHHLVKPVDPQALMRLLAGLNSVKP